jgi:hypothetical protein
MATETVVVGILDVDEVAGKIAVDTLVEHGGSAGIEIPI